MCLPKAPEIDKADPAPPPPEETADELDIERKGSEDQTEAKRQGTRKLRIKLNSSLGGTGSDGGGGGSGGAGRGLNVPT